MLPEILAAISGRPPGSFTEVKISARLTAALKAVNNQ